MSEEKQLRENLFQRALDLYGATSPDGKQRKPPVMLYRFQ
jgi:hypothetical protein